LDVVKDAESDFALLGDVQVRHRALPNVAASMAGGIVAVC